MAQYSLGDMFEEGRAVTQSDTEAARWHRKAADQGNELAQFSLGCILARVFESLVSCHDRVRGRVPHVRRVRHVWAREPHQPPVSLIQTFPYMCVFSFKKYDRIRSWCAMSWLAFCSSKAPFLRTSRQD